MCADPLPGHDAVPGPAGIWLGRDSRRPIPVGGRPNARSGSPGLPSIAQRRTAQRDPTTGGVGLDPRERLRSRSCLTLSGAPECKLLTQRARGALRSLAFISVVGLGSRLSSVGCSPAPRGPDRAKTEKRSARSPGLCPPQCREQFVFVHLGTPENARFEGALTKHTKSLPIHEVLPSSSTPLPTGSRGAG